MITIIGLGVRPGDLTQDALEALRGAGRVFARTLRHPAVEALVKHGIAVESMDDLYESCESFDELNQAIAQRLMDGEGAVYATPGSAATGDGQVAYLTALCGERGIPWRILPGIGWDTVAAADAGGVEGYAVVSAMDLRLPGYRIDPRRTLIVTEVDGPIIAGEVKLRLMEHYPDAHAVRMGEERLPLHAIDQRSGYSVDDALLLPPLALMQAERLDFGHLMEIVAILRDPIDGCPWDREQTHQSLLRYLIEEAYEVQDAVEDGDPMRIADELGDVLLQVALHSQIGREHGEFDEMDVTTAIARKMISRHTHIFGDAKASTAEEVSRNWAEIKKVEKGLSTLAEELAEVPRSFPALLRAEKMLKRAEGIAPDEAEDNGIARALLLQVEKARKSGLCAEQLLARYLDAWVARQEKDGT